MRKANRIRDSSKEKVMYFIKYYNQFKDEFSTEFYHTYEECVNRLGEVVFIYDKLPITIERTFCNEN